MINSMLKMAKKRALVHAVLSTTRSSDLFTLDMEDLKGMEPVKHPNWKKCVKRGSSYYWGCRKRQPLDT